MTGLGMWKGGIETYGRSFNNSNGLDDLLLVHLRTRAVEVAHNGRHAGFVTHGCCEVDGLFGVVLGEGLDLASMTGRPLTGQEGQRAMARRFELSVRHLGVWLLSMSMFEELEIAGFGACCGRYSLKMGGSANARLASAIGLSIRDDDDGVRSAMFLDLRTTFISRIIDQDIISLPSVDTKALWWATQDSKAYENSTGNSVQCSPSHTHSHSICSCSEF